MVNVTKQEVRMEESLRKRLEFIWMFYEIKYNDIDKINLTLLDLYRVIIKI